MVIRAVYENGTLRLLEPLHLSNGQTVTLDIHLEPNQMSEDTVIRSALGSSVRWADPTYDVDAWVEGMAEEIAEAFKGLRPLSEIIIEERNEGW